MVYRKVHTVLLLYQESKPHKSLWKLSYIEIHPYYNSIIQALPEDVMHWEEKDKKNRQERERQTKET